MLSTGLMYVSLALAVLAVIVSYFALQLSMRHVRDERDFRGLVLHLAELEDLHEALAASHKRLRSRVGMKDLRSKRKQQQDEDEDPPTDAEAERAEWKRRKRIQLHTGELKP